MVKMPKSQRAQGRRGPVVQGVQREPRGWLFALLFAGGYRRFFPAPTGLPWWARTIYYLRVLFGVVLSPLRPLANVFWLLRWFFTFAFGVYLVVLLAAVVYAIVTGEWLR